MAGGRLELREISVKNPEGFLLEHLASVDRADLLVDIPSLLRRKGLLVRDIQVQNARVNVVRNQRGELNIEHVRGRLRSGEKGPEPASSEPIPPREPAPERPSLPPKEPKPLPEVLVEALALHAQLCYLDLKLDNLELELNLEVRGGGLSTRRGSDVPWGHLTVKGALGDDASTFVTDLAATVAPVTDLQAPSFDLKGTILEIDPRVMEAAYDKLGFRMDPFGMGPSLRCRNGYFSDSSVRLEMEHIVFEDKLARRLGGVGSIDRLAFSVPVEGSLRSPEVNLEAAFLGAITGNASSLLNAIWRGVVQKETGGNPAPTTAAEAAVEVLADQVDEIGESETTQKVLKEIAKGVPSETNETVRIDTDALIDILGEKEDFIGENEEVKQLLKGLGRGLFGK
jgi:hypothetical protein